MNNSSVYKECMFKMALPQIKQLRDQWRYGNDFEHWRNFDSYYAIDGNDYLEYQFVMQESRSVITKMLQDIVSMLMDKYDYCKQEVPLAWREGRIYAVEGCDDQFIPKSEKGYNLALITMMNGKRVLLIFKESGMDKQLLSSMLINFKEKYKFDTYYYISFLEDEAYKEVLDYNDNVSDPGRGTRVVSFKFFMEKFFGIEEYECFKENLDIFLEETNKYLGISVVKKLSSHALYNYKSDIQHIILSHDYGCLIKGNVLDEEQRMIIEKRFFKEGYYEAMTGQNDFAISFVTAEWLYNSLSNAGTIDLSAIVMGYFKAVEQLLFKYLSFHTQEKDEKKRTISMGGKEKTKEFEIKDGLENKKQYPALTDDIINTRKKEISLGTLTSFYRFIGNKDLLSSDVNDSTYEYIKLLLNEVKVLRNGYFHKDNLYKWDVVNEVRDKAYMIFYLFLGAYQYSDIEKIEMNIESGSGQDSEYQKLCEYIHKKSYISGNGRVIPMFYLDGKCEIKDALIACSDAEVEYNQYGNPIHSGIYFKHFGKKEFEIKFNQGILPASIWEGSFYLDKFIANMPDYLSGPEKNIFAKGVFLL